MMQAIRLLEEGADILRREEINAATTTEKQDWTKRVEDFLQEVDARLRRKAPVDDMAWRPGPGAPTDVDPSL